MLPFMGSQRVRYNLATTTTTVEYFSAIKRNEPLIRGTDKMDLNIFSELELSKFQIMFDSIHI